jgi:uncharacterized protein involved in exopolysaccharide biosynthesis
MLGLLGQPQVAVPGRQGEENSCMNTSQGPGPFDPGGHRKVPRRHWLIVPGLAALGFLAAAAFVAIAPAAAPPVYTATAAVDVTPPFGQGVVLIPALVPDLHSQAQAVRSAGVAVIAGRMMHSVLSPRALSKKVTVTVPPNSFVLDIACADPSASGAAVCANDFARAYLTNRHDGAVAFVNAQVNWLQRTASQYHRRAAALTDKMNTLPAHSPQRAADRVTIASLTAQATMYAQRAASAGGQLANTSGGSIVTVATPPGEPGGPSRLPVLLSGLTAGLLVGVIAALLVGRRDKRIHGPGAT